MLTSGRGRCGGESVGDVGGAGVLSLRFIP